jgi:hypothetical protein
LLASDLRKSALKRDVEKTSTTNNSS